VAYGLLVGESHIKISPDKFQADFAIMQILNLVQADFIYDQTHLIIRPTKMLQPFDFDFEGCPDLFPVASFIASFCEGTSRLSGLNRLKFKESDRLSEMQKMLSDFNIHYSLIDFNLVIEGNPHSKRKNNPANSVKYADDHRIIMTQILFMLRLHISGFVENYKFIGKSFPNFISQIS
jgi:3-phosphoshikimate 1-carboxyvinyltransferase